MRLFFRRMPLLLLFFHQFSADKLGIGVKNNGGTKSDLRNPQSYAQSTKPSLKSTRTGDIGALFIQTFLSIGKKQLSRLPKSEE